MENILQAELVFYGILLAVFLVVLYIRQLDPMPPFFGNTYYKMVLRKNYTKCTSTELFELFKDLNRSDRIPITIELKKKKDGSWEYRDTTKQFGWVWRKLDFSGNWEDLTEGMIDELVEIYEYDISSLGIMNVILPVFIGPTTKIIFEKKT